MFTSRFFSFGNVIFVGLTSARFAGILVRVIEVEDFCSNSRFFIKNSIGASPHIFSFVRKYPGSIFLACKQSINISLAISLTHFEYEQD